LRSFVADQEPPCSDGSGLKPPAEEKTKGSGRKRGGQDGHPGVSTTRLDSCAFFANIGIIHLEFFLPNISRIPFDHRSWNLAMEHPGHFLTLQVAD
jgi:hypothetical protein